MNINNLASGNATELAAVNKPHHHYEFGTFNERLSHFCALFDIEPPEIVYEDAEPTLSRPLLDWIITYKANMDWLFGGSPSGMLRDWSEARGGRQGRTSLPTVTL